MALFTGTNFHKTFAIIIKFHLKLLCNNVTMYVLYVSPIFREYITFLRRKIPMELIIPEHYDPRLDIRETQDAIKSAIPFRKKWDAKCIWSVFPHLCS